MVAPKFPENIDEPLISAPVAPAKLVAGPAEAKKLSDPVADLKKAKNMPEAIEIMVALQEDEIIKVNEKDEYEPVDPKNQVAKEAIRIFKIVKNIFKGKETANAPTTHGTESRKKIKRVMNAPKPQPEKPQAKKPAQRPQPKLVAKPVEAKKLSPIQEKDQALRKMIRENKEYKIINRVLTAFSTNNPERIDPNLTNQDLEVFIRRSLDIIHPVLGDDVNQRTPKSIEQLVQWDFDQPHRIDTMAKELHHLIQRAEEARLAALARAEAKKKAEADRKSAA